jgi:transcriptional regulator with XRE-family HTH domain
VAQRSSAQVALGSAIRDFREARRISQEELGFLSGTHRTYIGGIERGERNPTFVRIRQLAAALQVPASGLIADAERREATGGQVEPGTSAG